MKPLVTPVVNLNGATAESLIKQRTLAVHAVNEAIHRMFEAMPHGRDYQHLIRGADWSEHNTTVEAAQAAWRERIEVLVALKDDLTNDALAIQEQEQEHARRRNAT